MQTTFVGLCLVNVTNVMTRHISSLLFAHHLQPPLLLSHKDRIYTQSTRVHTKQRWARTLLRGVLAADKCDSMFQPSLLLSHKDRIYTQSTRVHVKQRWARPLLRGVPAADKCDSNVCLLSFFNHPLFFIYLGFLAKIKFICNQCLFMRNDVELESSCEGFRPLINAIPMFFSAFFYIIPFFSLLFDLYAINLRSCETALS